MAHCCKLDFSKQVIAPLHFSASRLPTNNEAEGSPPAPQTPALAGTKEVPWRVQQEKICVS